MLNVDTEFKNLIPPLTDDEYKGLEASILEEGCRDALILWGDTIVDGHNRYEICTKHNIAFNTVQMDFDSRNAVKLWMMHNQLARRNLNDFQRIEITHKCEDAVKEEAEKIRTANLRQNAEVVKLPPRQEGKSRDILGKMAGVSGKTYEHAVKVLKEAPQDIVDATRRGDMSINQAYQIIKQPHVAMNSGNNEWYTPTEIIETARRVMGSIDLDPASSEIANQTVKAETYYTAETNGLNKKWDGNVWLNPPYSTELIDKFVDKLVEQKDNYKQAIVLVNNATETEWFEKIVNVASAVCFPRHRVKFYKPDGKVGAPLQGQAILYIGGASNKFTSAFSQLGWCADVLR